MEQHSLRKLHVPGGFGLIPGAGMGIGPGPGHTAPGLFSQNSWNGVGTGEGVSEHIALGPP